MNKLTNDLTKVTPRVLAKELRLIADKIEYSTPKSICTCGHRGDGPNSDHLGLNGHGKCVVMGCSCEQFTWSRWIEAFTTVLELEQQGD